MKRTQPDDQQFLELVNENRNRILKVCRVYAWNSADQDDLYQEILFQIWRGLPALKEKQFANTWLYRVAINTSITFVRKRASRADKVVHVEHAELARTIESRQTAEPTNDRLANLYAAIAKLNELEKALITLFLEDFSYDQMAEVMGITTSNVGVILHRAKTKLSCLMKEAVHE